MQDSFYRVSCQPDILTCRFNKYLKYKYNYLLFAKKLVIPLGSTAHVPNLRIFLPLFDPFHMQCVLFL